MRRQARSCPDILQACRTEPTGLTGPCQPLSPRLVDREWWTGEPRRDAGKDARFGVVQRHRNERPVVVGEEADGTDIADLLRDVPDSDCQNGLLVEPDLGQAA